ncbi:cell division protein FtsL [Enterovirga rhinocerotis]|uniref:Cell division protein FtsL n=1 Tax=Enterovirga rhinocerotis TaxID=1339210 RepID=A0A4R7BR49_9HYPH|nr:hypothetical protein [Enterovirga rhinocerotis]TDR88150.1 hypothetical protein EV668_4020 [Enterovirga rhinocerotis]
MIRLLHLLAISLLIGSAAYAYTTKYETLYYSETLSKMKAKLQKERETLAIVKAEWALLTRPDRLQRMVDRHLDLQAMNVAQLARFSDIPNKPNRDAIAAKLETLGLEPTSTGSTTPAGPPKPRPAPKRDGIAAKLTSLGLGPAPVPQRTVQTKPPARPAAKTAAKPAPSTGSAKPVPARPVPQPSAKPAAR